MESVSVLVVCTGNTCRSPLAEALLLRLLGEEGYEPSVRSAGTLGWSERPASAHAVAAGAERGVDLRRHVSRRLDPPPYDVDLVVAMTRDHAGAVLARDARLATRTYLPAEFARLARRLPGRAGDESVAAYIHRVGVDRPAGPIGRAADEIPDPAGEPLAAYRRVAERLERDLAALTAALAGRHEPSGRAGPTAGEDQRW